MFLLSFCVAVSARAQGVLAPEATPNESHSLEQWVERAFAKPEAATASQPSAIPFSFTYDGVASQECLPRWEFSTQRTALSAGWQQTNRYHDPKTGLVLTCELTVRSDAASADWVLWLENQGKTDTPIVADLMPLDATGMLEPTAEEGTTLRWSQGDGCTAESFLPHDELLAPGKERVCVGDASNTAYLPFFNVKSPQAGWIVAVGWTGHWKAEFRRDAQGPVALRAGMSETTRFSLKPGERVRTPSICLLYYQGPELIRGHNQFRRMYMTYGAPRVEGKPIVPPVAACSTAGLYLRPARKAAGSDRLSEATELKLIDLLAKIGGEVYWLDAYWYPQPWMENIGNWYPRPEDFPRGLRPLADAAHARDLKFVLWFVSAFAAGGTKMAQDYPQCFLGGKQGGLCKFDDPQVCETIIQWTLDRQKEWDFDVYREDAGTGYPPPDEPNRQGMNEMRHFAGFYHFWSELLKRNPKLVIDNCNGGGRRIDWETMRMSYVLWRSDFNDIGEGLKDKPYWPMMARADQVMVSGLSLYDPLHTGPIWDVRPYSFRSAMTQGIAFYNDFEDPNFPVEQSRQAVEELKSLRPLFVGDLYPLLPLTTSQADWYAYQLDRPDLGQGCALVFRRPENEETTREIPLQHLAPEAEYTVTLTGETYAKGPTRSMRGRELMAMKVEIPEKPGSVLIEYRRVKP